MKKNLFFTRLLKSVVFVILIFVLGCSGGPPESVMKDLIAKRYRGEWCRGSNEDILIEITQVGKPHNDVTGARYNITVRCNGEIKYTRNNNLTAFENQTSGNGERRGGRYAGP